MKQFFKDIFDYHHNINQKLTALFINNEDRLSKRTNPLFSHCINAHQLWNARITGGNQFGVFDVHSFDEIKSLDLQNYEDTLSIIESKDLSEIIAYTNSKGLPFENSIQKILFHIGNHFTHHKGQLISDLRQNGIEPLVTDYIYYQKE